MAEDRPVFNSTTRAMDCNPRRTRPRFVCFIEPIEIPRAGCSTQPLVKSPYPRLLFKDKYIPPPLDDVGEETEVCKDDLSGGQAKSSSSGKDITFSGEAQRVIVGSDMGKPREAENSTMVGPT